MFHHTREDALPKLAESPAWSEGDNPAERLYRLFSAVSEHPQPQDPAHQAWGQVLQLPNANAPLAFLNAANAMLRMTEQISQEVQGLGGRDAATILRHLPRVEKTIGQFTQVYSLTLTDFLGPLGPDGMYCLELCSHRLSERWRQVPAVANEVEDLLGKVKELLGDVAAAEDIPPAARIFITKHLLAVSVALHEARYLGWDGVELASDAALGAMAKNPGLMSKLAQSKAGVAAAGFLAAVSINVTTNVATKAITSEGQANQPPVVVVQYFEKLLGGPLELPPGSGE